MTRWRRTPRVHAAVSSHEGSPSRSDVTSTSAWQSPGRATSPHRIATVIAKGGPPTPPTPTPTNMRQTSRHSHARPAWAGATATNWAVYDL
jgi:hypothetical protein